jgi:hypothetical protein
MIASGSIGFTATVLVAKRKTFREWLGRSASSNSVDQAIKQVSFPQKEEEFS